MERENASQSQLGAEAGSELLKLLVELNPEIRPLVEQPTPDRKLSAIYDFVQARSGGGLSPCLEGFLSKVIKPETVEGKIITLFGANEFIPAQANQAPICEMSPDSGFIQIAYWTGISDGDGWCIKTDSVSGFDGIKCVPVYAGGDARQIQVDSYAVLDSLLQWVAYLRCSAWERGWLGYPGLDGLQLGAHTFEAGIEAGNQLLKLIVEVDPAQRALCDEAVPPEQLNKIYAEIQERSHQKRRIPCMEGFLSRVLKTKPLRATANSPTGTSWVEKGGRIIEIYSLENLIYIQTDFAPISNSLPEAGFTQFADWSGQSDSDGWWLDTEYQCIRCVSVDSGCEESDDNRAGSFGVFHSLRQWVTYLRCVAYERGLVTDLFLSP